MRVTGGQLRGRRLRSAAGPMLRPTSDRVREALFAALGRLEGARALDLYAGTGALAIEALSRGAEAAVLVERTAASCKLARANLEALALADRARVVRGDARAVVKRLGRAGERFDLVLVDPPYAARDTDALLRGLVGSGALAPSAQVIVESSARRLPAAVAGLSLVARRRYGDTVVTRFAAPGEVGPAVPRALPAGDPGTGLVPAGARRYREAGSPLDEDGTQREVGRVMSDRKSIALFPASFDPVTNGHLDLVHRARRVFDEVVVAVARNVEKGGTFTLEERLEMLEKALGDTPGVRITSFDSLTTDYAREIGARVLIRGLRAMSDFEYEFEMTLMNRHLNPDLETFFMITSLEQLYVSSSRLRELVRFGRKIDEFVPSLVARRLEEKIRES